MNRLYLATNNGDVSGGEIMLFAIARAARAEGREVLVIAPRSPDGVCRRADAEGFAVVRLAADSRPAYMVQLARWAARRPGAWIWANGLVPSVALLGHRRTVAHLHQVPTGLNRVFAAAVRSTGRTCLIPSAYGAATVPGTRAFPNWTEDLGAAPEALHARPAAPEAAGAAPGRGGAPLRIGFLGRISLLKGVDVLAHAVGILLERGQPVELHLAGDAAHIPAEEVAAVERALTALPAGTVHRHGRVPPARFHSQLDLLVVPSHCREVFGLTAAEAMSSGLPVVVTDDGALPEVLGAEHPWIARAGDAQDLARVLDEALDTVRQHPERSARIVRAARRRWEREHSPEAGRRRVRDVLHEILPDQSPSRRKPDDAAH